MFLSESSWCVSFASSIQFRLLSWFLSFLKDMFWILFYENQSSPNNHARCSVSRVKLFRWIGRRRWWILTQIVSRRIYRVWCLNERSNKEFSFVFVEQSLVLKSRDEGFPSSEVGKKRKRLSYKLQTSKESRVDRTHERLVSISQKSCSRTRS